MKWTLRSSSILGSAVLLAAAWAHGCSGADADPGSGLNSADAGGDTGNPLDSGFIDADIKPDPICLDPTDSDGDTIADDIEGDGDTDGDGIPDKLDLDSDDDGISDQDEATNPLLPKNKGGVRTDPCSPVANSDGNDDGPDFQDRDSDGDGILDEDERTGCANDCRVNADCDGDGVVDIVETAAGSDVCDASSIPTDASLYFIVPYKAGEQTQRFSFSTGIKDADVYFMIDTTKSMQAAIDNVKSSLDTKIIPTLLNGAPSAKPPIPAIPGAFIGVGDFKDVPWPPYGDSADTSYRNRFCIGADQATCSGGTWVDGSLTAPINNGGTFSAPDNVRTILNSLTAGGGGDGPEAATQAIYMALSSAPFVFTGGPTTGGASGTWKPHDPSCDPGLLGRVCFRPGKLPIFVMVTDAPLHNGPTVAYDYNPQDAGGTKTYDEVVAAMNALGAKIVGVPVQSGKEGSSAAARLDLIDLAKKTGSLYYEPSFGGREEPLVNEPTANGSVADEVVRLIGLLAGQGLNNVTTRTSSYDCPGNVDCDGNGTIDAEFHNVIDKKTSQPFDATQLVLSVSPVPSTAAPLPYSTIDSTTFYGVRGDKTVEFEVAAQNDVLQPEALTVLRALLRVQTPGGQALGGTDGIKVIYLVVPRYAPDVR